MTHLPRSVRKAVLPCVLAGLATVHSTSVAADEILWDRWGVPHVYADSLEQAAYLSGWAQARAHANALAEIFGRARGEAAAHWGPDYLESDRMGVLLDARGIARRQFESMDTASRARLDAFAAGVSDYVRANPVSVDEDRRWVFPVASDDVLAHGYQLLIAFLMYEYDYWAIQSYAEAGKKHDDVPGGSNGIAIAPARSASGTAMLVINPHLPWQGELMFFESHLVAGEVDAYGASLLGQPFLALGFTRHLGWTHTVNPADAFDTYELELEDDGYRFDGEVKAFQREDPQELAVRKEDGTTEKVLVERLRSVHGPVVYLDDRRKRALAVRIAAATDFRPERFWKIVEATNLEEFENVTDEHPLPFFNTIFADSDGNILFQYNATLPDRGRGDFESWLGILPGDDPDYLWEDMLPVSAMPKIVNPDTGFVQNANDPPWSATYPFALDTGDFPAWLPPPAMDFRAQSLTRMLHDDREISFDELVRIKQSNRVEMAGRVLPDLLAVCEEADAELLDKACRTLAGWDRTVDPDSRGAVLFLAWVDAMGGVDGDWYAEPWSVTRPLSTPNGLAAPEDALETLAAVAAEIDESFGAVDAAYGQVYRMRLGGRDVPARTGDASAGMPAVGGFDRAGDGHYEITDGDTFFAVVQFSKPLRAEGLLPYGNSSQPGSPHVGDQLELFSKGELRRLWLDRDDVLENLELRETFD